MLQFVDHRRSKIQNYIHNISKTYPIPVLCIGEGNKGKWYFAFFSLNFNILIIAFKNSFFIIITAIVFFSGARHRMRVHFRCQVADDHCIYDLNQFFSFKTHVAPIWLHLMFLQVNFYSVTN